MNIMDASMVSFVVKVMAVSALGAALIKYAVPLLAPSPSLGLCLVLLVAPSGLMAILFWRQAG